MRHILVNHAQAKAAEKRGGRLRRVTLRTDVAAPEHPVDILELNRALDCLNAKDPRMVAVIELRIFGNLTVQQISEALDVSPRTVDNLWKDHLLSMDHLKEGIGLRGYAQQNPLIVYKKEGFDLFQDMISRVKEETLGILFRIQIAEPQKLEEIHRS